MRTQSAAMVAALVCLVVAAPSAPAKPTHAETGVIINHKFNPVEEAQHVKGLNMGWGSLFVRWSSHQPASGSFQEADDLRARLTALKDQGLKTNVTFMGTPSWASGQADENYPPQDPQAFGNFVAEFAKVYGDLVDGYELGNEPDGGIFWLPGPDPAKYSGFAKAGLDAVLAHDPTAVKFIGATAGANDEFMEAVLRTGITGFDAVSFHSGTACKTDPPGHYIREDSGNADIHNNSYTGYRELVHMMRALGIANPVVADTNSGWSTTGAPCDRGTWKDKKPGGVSEAEQSQFLRDAFGCSEQDPELRYIFLFSLYDFDDSGTWDHRMGLRRADGSPKQAYNELAATLGSASPPPFSPGGFCGGYVDHTAPTGTLSTNAPVVKGEHYFSGALGLSAKGVDAHPVTDIDLFANGKEIPVTTRDGAVSLEWQGAKDLPLGLHTITAKIRDEAGNVGEAAALKVRKVKPSEMPDIATQLAAKVKRLKGRTVRVSGRFTAAGGTSDPPGHIRIRFKKGKFVSKYSVKADVGSWRKTVKLRRGGRWTVTVFYDGVDPFAASRAKRMTIRVR